MTANNPAKRRRTEHFASPQGSLVDHAQPLDGDALGEAWEKSFDAAARIYAFAQTATGRVAPEVCTTQPRYVGGYGKARPAGKGWVDRIICAPEGLTVHVELKAVVRQGSHELRWTLPDSLRADKDKGHQARRLTSLARLGHRAVVLLGVQSPERIGAWSAAYLIPVSPDGLPAWGSQASATWEELHPYKVRLPLCLGDLLAPKSTSKLEAVS